MIKDRGWGGVQKCRISAGKLPHNQRNQIINIKSFTFRLS